MILQLLRGSVPPRGQKSPPRETTTAKITILKPANTVTSSQQGMQEIKRSMRIYWGRELRGGVNVERAIESGMVSPLISHLPGEPSIEYECLVTSSLYVTALKAIVEVHDHLNG